MFASVKVEAENFSLSTQQVCIPQITSARLWTDFRFSGREAGRRLDAEIERRWVGSFEASIFYTSTVGNSSHYERGGASTRCYHDQTEHQAAIPNGGFDDGGGQGEGLVRGARRGKWLLCP